MWDGTLTATTTAAQLTTTEIHCTRVVVENDPTSTTNLLVGDSTSQSWSLVPGAQTTLYVNRVDLIYVKAVSGTPKCNWQAFADLMA